MPIFAADRLVSFTADLFRAAKVPTNEAELVARSLVEGNLAGHDSHGVIRVMQYVKAIDDGVAKPGAAMNVLRETPAVLVCDGGWGLGHVQGHRLLRKLFPMTKAQGLAAGTLVHCGHIGRLGEYAEAAAVEGLALIASVTNHGFGRAVAPPGGTAGRIGTNPLCIGVPTKDGDPIVLDIGTSVAAEGKVRVAFNKGQQVPDGWLLDNQGRPTTDPGTFYAKPPGTIQPLGGSQAYKGFGIGLLLDMLVAGLSGSPCSRPELPSLSGNAVLFVVFDAAHFAGTDHFLSEVTDLATNVRNCPRAEGVAEILLPGDPERKARAQRRVTGIPLDDGTWGQLVEVAKRFGVVMPG